MINLEHRYSDASDDICHKADRFLHAICKITWMFICNYQGGFMQIRRSENLLFPNFKTNVVSNHKFLAMTNVGKRDISATVTISREGRAKARMLEESSKKDDYMKHAESKIDNILDTIRNGGTLSKEEEELVNNELKNMSEQKYKDYKDLRLSPEDVIKELKDNYLRREKLFFDMQNQMEAEADNSSDDFDSSKIMAYMQEKEYDEKIIEMVEKYGEEEDEKELKETSETEETAELKMDEQKINLNVGEEPKDETALENGNLKKRAMEMLEGIENQMNDVEEASNQSRKKEIDFAKNLEEDYKRIHQIVNRDEVSVKEKVKAYDRFVEEAGKNAKDREVERIRKEFDAETLMMARIMILGQNRMGDILNGNTVNSQLGTEFMKAFLI